MFSKKKPDGIECYSAVLPIHLEGLVVKLSHLGKRMPEANLIANALKYRTLSHPGVSFKKIIHTQRLDDEKPERKAQVELRACARTCCIQISRQICRKTSSAFESKW